MAGVAITSHSVSSVSYANYQRLLDASDPLPPPQDQQLYRRLQAVQVIYLSGDFTYLPPEIGHFGNLQRLALGYTSIQTLPPEMGQLDQLQALYLNNTAIRQLPPEIGLLVNLQELNLGNSAIQVLPPELGQLTNLREVYLHNTAIRELPVGFDQLTQLRYLGLSNTAIKELPPQLQARVAILLVDGTPMAKPQ